MSYTREQIDKSRVRLLKASRSLAQADVYLVELDGRLLVHKDFAGKLFLWRWLIGRTVISREARAHVWLEDVQGVPRLIVRPDPYSMVMEYVQGEPLSEYKRHHPLTADLFSRLNRLVHEMHRNGVAHGDMHKRNLFRSDDGTLYILDFATALCVDDASGWLKRLIFKKMCTIDEISVARIKAKYSPELLTEDEAHALEHIPFYLKAGRFLRKRIYRPLIKTKTWRKRHKKLKEWLSRK